ncbi:MAG: hypothetical protein AMXMBFR4_08900 [Candidatus Hydrogenedentota bacterium]
MKLALLMGNRFNPWHLQGFKRLRGNPEVTAFRAESQIQDHFKRRGDGTEGFKLERIYFDTQAGNVFTRLANVFAERYRNRTPRIVPFHDRLHDYDIIHSWELFTDWSREAVIARKRFRIPLVVTVWDLLPFNMERTAELRDIKQRVARGADRFVVYTDRSREMLGFEGIPKESISVIHPGVDIDAFQPGAATRQFGLRPDDFVILFVGWFVPRKGIDFLLYAVRKLIDDGGANASRLKLLIVGSGYGRERVNALIARLDVQDRCTIVGPLTYNQMPDVFRASDVFVLPSIATDEWQEQFGMSLIEAMACGVPSVASLSGAIPEVAEDAALLCQPNDFHALHRALRRIIDSQELRSELAAKARRRAVSQFNLQTHAEALSDLYESIL